MGFAGAAVGAALVSSGYFAWFSLPHYALNTMFHKPFVGN